MGNANGVCSSDLGFFEAAKAGCVGHGHLTTFAPNEKCGLGSSSSATFSCCPTAPKGCVSGGAGNANGECSTNESMFASAEECCKQLHLDVTGFSADDKCGKDSSNSFTFTCCP